MQIEPLLILQIIKALIYLKPILDSNFYFMEDKTRNIGIIAHIDAGKTTTSERILFYTGISHKIGEVHEGAATMDWMEQEKEKGITICSAATTCYWRLLKNKGAGEYRINIIDTPGHIDFTAEVQRSLRVLDGAVVLFEAVSGVESQSETVWRQADKYKTPRICFINKIDRAGGDFYKSLKSIHTKLTKKAVALQMPIGEEADFEGIIDLVTMKAVKFNGDFGENVIEYEIPENLKEKAIEQRNILIEKVAGEDDVLMEKYLEGEEISIEDLRKALRKAVIDYKIVPVLVGTALRNKGVQLLLDAIIYYLPSPSDVGSVIGTDIETDEEIIRKTNKNEPFAALAFKIATDPFVGVLTYIRVYSGILKKGSYVLNPNTGKKERIGRILQMHANDRKEIDEVTAGNIATIVGLKKTFTGNTLCDLNNPIILEKISFPEPVVAISIEPKTKKDQEKMGIALKKLSEEDPTFKIKGDPETGETIMSGMGELHLDIIIDRMKREFGVEANVGQPRVAYKETIRKESKSEIKYSKQTGGRGQFAHVYIKIKPLNRGEGFKFIDAIKGGVIPKSFIPAVEQGIIEAATKGVLSGHPIIDIEATLYDGSYHDVDSSEMAFKVASSMALKDAVSQASPVILEPIMKTEITIPAEFLGDITGDISSKRGQIQAIEDSENLKIISALIPLSEMFGYVTTLRSLTKGRGTFMMEFDRYQETPANIAEKIKN